MLHKVFTHLCVCLLSRLKKEGDKPSWGGACSEILLLRINTVYFWKCKRIFCVFFFFILFVLIYFRKIFVDLYVHSLCGTSWNCQRFSYCWRIYTNFTVEAMNTLACRCDGFSLTNSLTVSYAVVYFCKEDVETKGLWC